MSRVLNICHMFLESVER